MSITAECSACGRRYQAPASLAGKRVRCKQCGNIFQLPEAEAHAEGAPNVDALAELEKSYHSMDATGTGERPPDDEDEESDGSPGALRSSRMNVRFDFPFARELDHWLPMVLFILGMFWLGKQGYSLQLESSNNLKWMAGARVGLAFLAYLGIIAPITLALIRSAGQRLGYRMPVGDRWRGFVCFLPAFALTYAMWVNGDGDLKALFLGGLVGLMLGMAATWFLFRLSATEIAPTAAYAGIGYFIGLGICALIFFGLNLLAVNVLENLRKLEYTPPLSPFGPGVAWVDPEKIKPPTVTKVIRPVTTQATPDVVDTAAGGIVKTQKVAPITDTFESVIFPLTDSRFLATSRLAGTSIRIESWNTDTWTSLGSHPFATAEKYVLSPDGDRLAMISRFPSLSAQIWSFRLNQPLPLLYLENRPGQSTNPELVGFLNPQVLLTRWQRPGGYAVEAINIGTREQVFRLEVPNYEAAGNCVAINRDGSRAVIAAKDTTNGKPTLFLYDLTTGKQMGDKGTEIGGLDPQWPVTPTGLAFSFDSRKLAIMFEQGGNGLVKLYQLDPNTGAMKSAAEYFYPAGPLPGRDLRTFTGNALNWTPDGSALLAYGQGLFSASSGKFIQDLGITGVERCRVQSPDGVTIIAPAPPVPHQITILQLDLPRINMMAGQ